MIHVIICNVFLSLKMVKNIPIGDGGVFLVTHVIYYYMKFV